MTYDSLRGEKAKWMTPILKEWTTAGGQGETEVLNWIVKALF